MIRPSDRINELTRLAAEETMRLEGTEDPRRAEQLLEDPRVILAALLTYLDEQDELERVRMTRRLFPEGGGY